ncbi:cation:proton antiporter [Pseudovibrio ascidiaceicola]|jgi:multicomponent Na+:H+ antiporter subunit F|uniref:Multicomponent Na+:H+ antiporter subunit F n=1 Tax=Pseudovibrio ascidiaceicola TaxID=285279 RepID=A0A1I4DC44_9HYPH|nr:MULTISPECIES: cation:proton antiporter [Pseudovibrio]KZL06122.1 Na(+)/H(+) antiporter subunit F [Pseudovibrio sp. Ad26]KZL25118.1 Na(+)/H(+) antiporter subunit F [Pseudovibrio sp. Ad37]SFK90479.1 multicomponent Na+:H+ antiporter subunit F [Pseudovibrio ascidiaceicola]
MNGFEAFAADFLYACVSIALFILGLTFLLIVYRIIKGPTLPDRIVGLDLLVVVAIGLIATVGVGSSYTLYIDISLALGLVGFLATVAFARFILNRGQAKDFIIMQEIKDSEKQEEQK